MIKVSKTKRKRTPAKRTGKRTKKNYKLAGGASPDSGLCKKDINELLVPENKTAYSPLIGDPKQFVDDIKKQTTSIENLGKSNWLAGPGPPPAFPKCVIM